MCPGLTVAPFRSPRSHIPCRRRSPCSLCPAWCRWPRWPWTRAHGVAWPSHFFQQRVAAGQDGTGGFMGWPKQTKGCVRNARERHGIMGNIIYSLNAENLPFLPPRQQTNPCPVMTKSLPFYYFSIGFRCSVSVPYRLAWWLRAPVSLRTLSETLWVGVESPALL